MRAAVLGLSAVLTCAMTAPAGAATLVNADGVLTYTGAPGESNQVAFERMPDGTTRASAYGATPTTVDGCTALPPVGVVDGTPYTPYDCAGVETVVADLGDGDDYAITTLPATLSGGAGQDTLIGSAAADRLDGGPGDDTLRMTPGDTIVGGSGVDTAELTDSSVFSVVLDPTLENATAYYGVTAPLTLTGNEGANRLAGGDGGDTITGGRGSDVLIGNGGDDLLNARDGEPDRVECGTGNDVVIADQYDQVGDSCESVARELVLNALDARPPTIAWATGAKSKLVARPATTLRVDATGAQKVEFYDDDRVVCTDTTAPFTCAYAPRLGDVGRNTLRAVATDASGQTASVLRTVTVARFAPHAVSLHLERHGNRVTATGKVTLPKGIACSGVVEVRTGATTRTDRLGRGCTYSVSFPRGRTFVAAYRGTDAIAPKHSTRKVAR
ncbi:Ig-like domain-containing protein [Solirubrobacter soli]|uniref:Ig-like domain-containing protein n=1 Tax=Solirubrobacter soli TaxID=363832 RepID=UPI00041B7E02|nr:Ig-like domain-containing protein [Solirubrobacter soli]